MRKVKTILNSNYGWQVGLILFLVVESYCRVFQPLVRDYWLNCKPSHVEKCVVAGKSHVHHHVRHGRVDHYSLVLSRSSRDEFVYRCSKDFFYSYYEGDTLEFVISDVKPEYFRRRYEESNFFRKRAKY